MAVGGTGEIRRGYVEYERAWRGWWQRVSDIILHPFCSLYKWFMVSVESEVPLAQPLMWMGIHFELGGVVM